MNFDKKRRKEKELVQCMVEIYCRCQHFHTFGLCEDCSALLAYALKKIDNCPLMETKSFCSQCTVHCYSPFMRKKIRKVMVFSGPRLIFIHPLAALNHLFHSMLRR